MNPKNFSLAVWSVLNITFEFWGKSSLWGNFEENLHCGEATRVEQSAFFFFPLGLFIFGVPTVHWCGNCGHLNFPHLDNFNFYWKVWFLSHQEIIWATKIFAIHWMMVPPVNLLPIPLSRFFLHHSLHIYIHTPQIDVSFCEVFFFTENLYIPCLKFKLDRLKIRENKLKQSKTEPVLRLFCAKPKLYRISPNIFPCLNWKLETLQNIPKYFSVS